MASSLVPCVLEELSLEYQKQGVTPHLLVYPWMVLPRGNGTFLPGIWGHLGVPIWLVCGKKAMGCMLPTLLRWCGVGLDGLLVEQSCLVSVLEIG